MFFLGRNRRWPAALLLLAIVGSTEAMPLTFFGLGLYFALAPKEDAPRGWKLGLAVCAASAAWWLADMAVIHHFSRQAAVPFAEGYWDLFAGVVPAGTPRDRVLAEVLAHPLRDAAALFSSRFRFYHVLRALFFMGGLALAAPAATLPFWTTAFPYVLAAPAAPIPFLRYYPHLGFADFQMHEGAYVFAALLWATARGIKSLHARLEPSGRQGWLLPWVLLIGGLGFKYAQRTLDPNWRPTWYEAMPRVEARIPPNARLWAPWYAAAPVSNRRWLKITDAGPTTPTGFDGKLFAPDDVLIDKAFAVYGKPPFRDRLLTYLGRSGYRKVMEDTGVILLEAPHPAPDPESVPGEWIVLPEADPEIAETYAHYLLLDQKAAAPEPGASAPRGGADLAEADNDLGLSLAGEGKLDEAIRHYEAALRARPDYAEAHNDLGGALAQQGKVDEAIVHFRRALAINPGYGKARINLGTALTGQRKWDEAIQNYEEALRASPDFAEAHNGLAVTLAQQGKVDEAVAHFRRALEINPKYEAARNNLNIVLKRLGRQ
jgi:tetratricopeptide (TPR) repeat protein